MSEINCSRRNPNTYVGTFFIPDHLQQSLIDYFHKLETQKLIIIHALEKVIDIQISVSLTMYQPEKGWSDIKPREWNQIVVNLNSDNPNITNTESIGFFRSLGFNHNWDFRKHTNSNRAINLYCNFPRSFNYNNLPFGIGGSSRHLGFTKREKTHLNELKNNNVVQVFFQSHRLNESFSLDYYWVELELEIYPFNRLSAILAYLPLCNIFLTETKIFMLLRLTKNLVERIKSGLNWKVISVIPHNVPKNRTIDWYDSKNLKWKPPEILE